MILYEEEFFKVSVENGFSQGCILITTETDKRAILPRHAVDVSLAILKSGLIAELTQDDRSEVSTSLMKDLIDKIELIEDDIG